MASSLGVSTATRMPNSNAQGDSREVFLSLIHISNPNMSWRQYAPTVDGQMQVSSVRNVAMTPPQFPTTEAPGPYFQKGFFHNGYLKSLKQLVHFYNTRDKYAYPVTSGHCPKGTTEKVDCWPMPEVRNNICLLYTSPALV